MKQSSLKLYLRLASFKRKLVLILIFAIFIAIFCLPQISSFAYYQFPTEQLYQRINQMIGFNFEPEIETIQTYVTAYSSSLDETDDSPCLSASGYNLCLHNKENVVASNLLPFGTKIRIPDLDPDKIYTVVDRMHERYNSRIDIWMTSKQKAKNFGLKYLTVEIYK